MKRFLCLLLLFGTVPCFCQEVIKVAKPAEGFLLSDFYNLPGKKMTDLNEKIKGKYFDTISPLMYERGSCCGDRYYQLPCPYYDLEWKNEDMKFRICLDTANVIESVYIEFLGKNYFTTKMFLDQAKALKIFRIDGSEKGNKRWVIYTNRTKTRRIRTEENKEQLLMISF